jgi:hypothetical protein
VRSGAWVSRARSNVPAKPPGCRFRCMCIEWQVVGRICSRGGRGRRSGRDGAKGAPRTDWHRLHFQPPTAASSGRTSVLWLFGLPPSPLRRISRLLDRIDDRGSAWLFRRQRFSSPRNLAFCCAAWCTALERYAGRPAGATCRLDHATRTELPPCSYALDSKLTPGRWRTRGEIKPGSSLLCNDNWPIADIAIFQFPAMSPGCGATASARLTAIWRGLRTSMGWPPDRSFRIRHSQGKHYPGDAHSHIHGVDRAESRTPGNSPRV